MMTRSQGMHQELSVWRSSVLGGWRNLPIHLAHGSDPKFFAGLHSHAESCTARAMLSRGSLVTEPRCLLSRRWTS